jgi:endonuclease/exonuclease/phosphatase family metal-dependent hydrolase
MKPTFFFLLLFVLSIQNNIFSQEKKDYKLITIAFYNLENLFDTIIDPDTNRILQDEFTPNGVNKWNTEKYNIKLGNMSKVISELGVDVAKTPPTILGISEIENKKVVEDLTNHTNLKKYNYGIVHYESPDKRGVDVGLLYRKEFVKIKNSKSYSLIIPNDLKFKTRAQLFVEAEIDGETMYFIVNHWPSRRGGEKRSAPFREAAAKLSRSIADSVLAINPKAKIIMMGDLNDQPTDPSVKKIFKTSGDSKNMKPGEFYNTMENFFKNGIGTGAWRDTWSLFDQLIISPAFISENKTTWAFYQAHIFNKPYLIQQTGNFKGYPYRTFVGNNFMGGFSDHFPVYLFLIKEK